MDKKKCVNCQAYEKIDNDQGECHYNSPVPIQAHLINFSGEKGKIYLQKKNLGILSAAIWPVIDHYDWCLKFIKNPR